MRRVPVILLLMGSALGAQDLASSVAKTQELLEAAQKASNRAEAAGLIEQALDRLKRAPGTNDDGSVAGLRWYLAKEAGRRQAWPLAERGWRAAEVYYRRFPGDKELLLSVQSGLAAALAQQAEPKKRKQALTLQRQI